MRPLPSERYGHRAAVFEARHRRLWTTWLAVVLIVAAVISTAPPALAADAVRESCKYYEGPDGAGGAWLQMCIYLDKADEGRVYRARVTYRVSNNTSVNIHFRRITLIGGAYVLREIGPFVRNSPNSSSVATAWFAFAGCCGSRLYSSTSFHLCWMSMPGDPCGQQRWLRTEDYWG